MGKELKIKSQSGAILVATLDEVLSPAQDNPIVIIAHGFMSTRGCHSCITLAGRLNELGISTIRFDFYGHGDSGGKFEDITLSKGVADILSIEKYVRTELGYLNISLEGTSYGGAVALLASARIEAPFKCVVLKSPVSDYQELDDEEHGPEGIAMWKERGYIEFESREEDKPPDRVNYSFYEDFDGNNGMDEAHNVQSPTLIVHGDIDVDVPVKQVEKLAPAMPDCRLEIIKGAGHRFDEGDTYTEMMELMVSYFKEKLL